MLISASGLFPRGSGVANIDNYWPYNNPSNLPTQSNKDMKGTTSFSVWFISLKCLYFTLRVKNINTAAFIVHQKSIKLNSWSDTNCDDFAPNLIYKHFWTLNENLTFFEEHQHNPSHVSKRAK